MEDDPQLPAGALPFDLERASAPFLKAVLERVPAAVAVFDGSLVFRWANAAFAELYASPLNQAIGRSFDQVFPDAGGELRSSLVEVMATGRPLEARGLRFEYTHAGCRRTSYWDIALGPSGLPGGGVLLLSTDVTDRVEREQRQHAEIATLQKAETFRNEILGLVSHELRTPLHALMGFGRLLLIGSEEPLSTRQASYVERMLEVAGSLASIVNDILDVGQLQAGTLTMAFETVEVGEAAREVIRSLAPLASQKQLVVALDALPPGEVLARGDAARTRQVLTNLLGNATKFTPAGGQITVRVRQAGDRVRTEVQDNGPGIAAEDLPRLFAPFSQVDMSSTRSHKGSGLGLSIAKGLVEAQGGAIGVQSAPGEGSIFWFELPCAPAT